ncbi:hypothetical protein [Pontibacter sp. H249]|uniref:hypothetical protein n=1 Tax=Pontibacter sp. H249 TaxID=3133420 RepID=UPI0030BE659A
MSNDFLILNFSPSKQFLSAVWQRPVSSQEYRHGIRTIAVCINTLKAQYVITDVSAIGAPSLKDQHCTAEFLEKALSNTSLKRSARVLSQTKEQWEAYERVLKKSAEQPYEINEFSTYSDALLWILGSPSQPDDMRHIPMPGSTSELRRLLNSNILAQIVSAKGAEAITNSKSILLYQTDFVTISLNQDISLLSLKWLRSVDSHEYRLGIQKGIQALVKHQPKKMMINNQRLGVPSLNDQKWLLDVATETLRSCILTKIAVVNSVDAMQQLALEQVGTKIRNSCIDYQSYYFYSEEEALEWLTAADTVNYVAKSIPN